MRLLVQHHNLPASSTRHRLVVVLSECSLLTYPCPALRLSQMQSETVLQVHVGASWHGYGGTNGETVKGRGMGQVFPGHIHLTELPKALWSIRFLPCVHAAATGSRPQGLPWQLYVSKCDGTNKPREVKGPESQKMSKSKRDLLPL